MKRLFTHIQLLAIAMLGSGCNVFNPKGPLDLHYYRDLPANDTLVVLLPGIGDRASAFETEGVVDYLKDCRPDTNIVGVDAHFGYYRNKSVAVRLHEDVVMPARKAGVSNLWFVGVSLGGLGSLIYRQDYPQEPSQAILVAPFVGEWDELSRYLAEPSSRDTLPNQDFVPIWDALLQKTRSRELTLAYGTEDKYARQHAWLENQLPSDRVIKRSGDHRWTVWRELIPVALGASGLCADSRISES